MSSNILQMYVVGVEWVLVLFNCTLSSASLSFALRDILPQII